MRLKLNIVSTYRAQIYGFAILWILVFHGGAINSCDFSFGVSGLGWLNSVIGVGNVGVDIFLFLSGISLYFSFTKDPDYRSFIKKRLQRVAILLALTYLAIYLFSQQAPELYELWEIALTRIPVFIIGSWFGKFVYDKREVNPAWAILILIGVFAFAYVLHAGMLDGMAKRLFYAVGGISGCYALALVFLLFDKIPIVGKGLNLFFGFFGAFTLELYCTQGMLNQILRMLPIYEVGNVGQFAIMAVCAIVLAWIAMKLCNALIRQLKKSAAPEPKQ
ncbi:MAG: acyltransferase family protein [Coriobacteriales bacterium]|nr:acyltransferase family protein [Coriobacteriales bacterium]